MTAEELRNQRYNTQQEKLFLEVAAQIAELNTNFIKLFDKIDLMFRSKEKELKKEKEVLQK